MSASVANVRLGAPSDACALQRLYERAGQKPRGIGFWADQKALAAELANPRRVWVVAEGEQGIRAAASLTLDPENRIAKLYRLLTLAEGQQRHELLHDCLGLAMRTLVERDLADVAYCTARTINSADQLLTLAHGFKAIGVFPNAPSADGQKVSGLAAWYAPGVITRRYTSFALHAAVRPFYELARDQLGLEPIPAAPAMSLSEPEFALPTLEVIQAPLFVAEHFKQLRLRRKLSSNFYPFQAPNVLVTSPDQGVEVFAAVPPELRFAAIIGEHLRTSAHPVALYRAVSELLRQTGAAYIEVINDASDTLGIECILRAGFSPCGYFPALKSADDVRRDFVVFARTLEPVEAPQSPLPEAFGRYFDAFLAAQS